MPHDLVIKNADLADGTGAPARMVDIAIEGSHIVEVGDPGSVSSGRRNIDAAGRLVTPGFVDVHSHYDGQATWDPLLTPSSGHGVTTTVMGNCGVGFAPAAPDRHDWLIQLMEGVEDIPGAALAEGIDWAWESFPEYLDVLESQERVMDIATHVPHGAVRAYVMGERGATNAEANEADRKAMAAIVAEGVDAGALGFSTSRTMLHRALDGEPVPGTFAGADELIAIGRGVAAAGGGVFEVASDLGLGGMAGQFGEDLDWFAQLADETGLTVTYALIQADRSPDQWRELLDHTWKMGANGGRVVAQVAGRPAGLLLGLETSLHPFKMHPAYLEVADRPLAERVAYLRKPETRSRILGEKSTFTGRFNHDIVHGFWKMYELGDPPDYEPAPETSLQARADAAGLDPYGFAYDLLLEKGGTNKLFFPLTDYAGGNLDPTWERLHHDGVMLSLADGGAHCRLICDASTPTFMLSHWVRDRSRGPRIELERAVALQTSRTAAVYGLLDRGVVAPGYRADLNLIDLDELRLGPPRMVDDLPARGERLIQDAYGYVATVAGGEVTFENGESTGALPGRLVRGRQSALTG